MIKVKWTSRALVDLVRLHNFLEPVNPRTAATVVQALSHAPDRLCEHPRLGARLEEFDPREVRHIFVDAYEMRYELQHDRIFILRLWHSRENR